MMRQHRPPTNHIGMAPPPPWLLQEVSTPREFYIDGIDGDDRFPGPTDGVKSGRSGERSLQSLVSQQSSSSTSLFRVVQDGASQKKEDGSVSAPTSTFTLGNCIVEFPSDADQEFTTEKLSLQVNQFASVKIIVDKSQTHAPEKPSPCKSGHSLPSGVSFQVVNPKSLEKMNCELLESTTQLYKRELPAMNFAADTGKESDFLRNCTMNGKYCSLLLKKPGDFLADPEVVVGAITYQILPTSTQYAEIPLAAVDQAHQRQGLGKLLVGELARRLMDVGVLTLFCWGDQESEKFWNKQGFLKIAEVNAQGKPHKLRLKNEIRKAMSLPGNSALMVCNLPNVNTSTSTGVGGTSHQTPWAKEVTPTIEKEAIKRPKTVHGGAEQSPKANSDVDPYYFENNLCETPLSSNMRPSLAELIPSCPIRGGANSKGKTSVRGSSSKLSITTPTAGSASPSAKSSRTLRFADLDRVATVVKEVSGSPTPVLSGQVDSTLVREVSGPALKPCTESRCEEKGTLFTIDIAANADGECREPLRNVQNVLGQDVAVSAKKRPWRRLQCDEWLSQHSRSKAMSAMDGPQSADTGCGPDKENKDLGQKEIFETECDATVGSLKSRRKRPRAETLPEKTIPARSVTRPMHDGISYVKTTERQTTESQLLEFSSISEQVVSPLKADAADPHFQAPECRMPVPSSISQDALTAPQAGVDNPAIQTPEPIPASNSELVTTPKAGNDDHVAVLNGQLDSATRDSKAVDRMQSIGLELFSPPSLSEQHMNLRMQKQGKGSTIRKRLSTRPVHVPEVGVCYPRASVYLNDSAKTTAPVVFVMSMPNDPKKKALAQFGQMVEKLGGKVTGDGGECTHVIANEVRRTLNFCTALCSGAWVVTPDWLKASHRHKSFLEEESYLLRDKQFESKYKVSLATAIHAAQRNPRSLFAGFSVYPTPHVQPPLHVVTKLTEVAGGKVLSSLDEALQQNDPSHTIVLTCDVDKAEGDIASKSRTADFRRGVADASSRETENRF